MKRKYKFIFFSAAVLILCAAAYWVLKGTSEEEKVRKVLFQLTTLAEKPQGVRPTELAVKLKTLQTVFADSVSIDFGARKLSDTYTPRSLEPMLVSFRKHFVETTCSMSDVEITLQGDRANAVFACRFKGVPRQGNRVDEVRDVSCQLVKRDQKWYIENISINDILER